MSLSKSRDEMLSESQRSPGTPTLFLTVFTPTYNRAHTLPDAYRSLCEQTDKDFVWLIVDDGSADDTAALVAGWQSEGLLKIQYVAQENGGKHIAYNRALEIADSELFYCLDSDDMLTPNCVERLKYHWSRMKAEKSQAKGICFQLSKGDGGKWNEDFPVDNLEARFPELVYNGTIRGDIAPVFDLETVKRFRYPETWRRIYVPDAMMPFAVSSIAEIRFVNERLGIYRWDAADEERLSNFSRPENLTTGGATSLYLGNWIRLNYGLRYVFRYPVPHLRLAVQYNRFADLAQISFGQRLAAIEHPFLKFIVLLGFVPGRLVSWLTMARHRRARKAADRKS